MIDLKNAIHELNDDINFLGATMLTEGECVILLRELERLQALTADIPLDRLEAICAAEREGKVVVLPCKVGDAVYFGGKQGVVADVGLSVPVRVKHGNGDDFLRQGWSAVWKDFSASDFGKTVFLIRAQAEAALAGEGKG